MRAGRRGELENESSEVNLVPIMNLVLILIPLLLLSVVFLQVVVLPVTMSTPALKPSDTPPPERLRVVLLESGFAVYRGPELLPAQEGCTASGVTLCASGEAAVAGLEVQRYPWHALYNTMLELKSEPEFAKRFDIELVAGDAVPFNLLVRTMDVLRHQRVGGFMSSASALSVAPVARDPEGRPQELFSRVSLGLP